MSRRADPGRAGAAAWRAAPFPAALLLAVLLPAALLPRAAPAHGALLQAETAQAIRLQARYDTGQPMAGAQVIVFAPVDPAAVWARGETDSDGGFVFLPDPAQAGRWTVQVRQAGHGAVAHVDTAGAAPVVATAGSRAGGPDWVQRLVMVALVAWGALGTALWFRRERGQTDASA